MLTTFSLPIKWTSENSLVHRDYDRHGYMEADLTVSIALLMDFLNTDEKRERRMVHLPMGRFGEAVEVAKGALFRTSIIPI